MIPSFIAAAVLLAASAVLIARHWVVWRAVVGTLPEPQRRDFAWRQFRRRVQTSGLLGTVGLAILLGELLPWPMAQIACWSAAVLFTLWMVLLALADILATHVHFSQAQQREFRRKRS